MFDNMFKRFSHPGESKNAKIANWANFLKKKPFYTEDKQTIFSQCAP